MKAREQHPRLRAMIMNVIPTYGRIRCDVS